MPVTVVETPPDPGELDRDRFGEPRMTLVSKVKPRVKVATSMALRDSVARADSGKRPSDTIKYEAGPLLKDGYLP